MSLNHSGQVHIWKKKVAQKTLLLHGLAGVDGRKEHVARSKGGSKFSFRTHTYAQLSRQLYEVHYYLEHSRRRLFIFHLGPLKSLEREKTDVKLSPWVFPKQWHYQGMPLSSFPGFVSSSSGFDKSPLSFLRLFQTYPSTAVFFSQVWPTLRWWVSSPFLGKNNKPRCTQLCRSERFSRQDVLSAPA